MNPIIKLRKRPQLALLFTALLVIFCRGHQSKADSFGPGCVVYMNYFENGELGSDDQYDCPITCPDGSTVIGEGEEGDKYDKVEADGLSKCTEAATATPTATSEPQQETSTPTAAATPQPFLTGDVKACNLVDSYINFSLASGAADAQISDLQVAINGQPVKCEVPASNKNVLTCILPQGQTFPAQINVNLDGRLTDIFSYDGSGCTDRLPNNNDDPAQDPPDTGLPTCTGVPPYPEGCTPP